MRLVYTPPNDTLSDRVLNYHLTVKHTENTFRKMVNYNLINLAKVIVDKIILNLIKLDNIKLDKFPLLHTNILISNVVIKLPFCIF